MSDAYLPGLTVCELMPVRKVRRLPLKGEVLVKAGEWVEPDTVVAQTFVPGRPHLLAVSHLLNIEPGKLPGVMLKKAGDSIRAGEVIARYSSFFGLAKGRCLSPVTGVVEHISPAAGQVTIREPAAPVAVKAYISGTVTKIIPGEGAEVETKAALIQGIFGIGGEGSGKLRLAADNPREVLTPGKIRETDRGCILVGGSVTAATLRQAEEAGVTGIICGSILDKDLNDYLGYPINMAITGHENIPLTLVITEGFGKMPMAQKIFALLYKLAGRQASISGSTQIRAGVIRPEIVVPWQGTGIAQETAASGLELGSRVRIIRNPWFGKLGKITGLPVGLEKIESEALVRVAQVELESGRRVTVPRANVEIFAE